MKTRVFLLVAMLATGFLPFANAGSQDAPEITDAADDVAIGESLLVGILNGLPVIGGAPPFEDVEILKAWVNETDDTIFTINIESAGDIVSDTSTTITFSVNQTETSEFGSSSDGTIVTLELTGNTIDSGATNATADNAGAVQTITLTREEFGVSGGDVFSDFTVSRAREGEGTLPPVLAGETAEDTAGPGTDYVFNRDPVVGAGMLHIMGGEIGDESFEGTTATIHEDAAGFFTAHVTNIGTDADNFMLQATVTNGTATVAVDPMTASLNPGADTMFTVSFNATDSEESVTIDLHLSSDNGADTMALLTVALDDHDDGHGDGDGSGDGDSDGDNADREVKPEFLSFLTPAAEAMNMDDAFDEYAELVLLLLILLLLILLILLLLLLLKGGWIAGAADPKTITAAPGDNVEFALAANNRRKEDLAVQASFVSDGVAAGISLQNEDGSDATTLDEEGAIGHFNLNAKGDEGDHAYGKLHVTAPELEGKHNIDVWFTPLDEDGEPRTKKASKVRAVVKVVDESELEDVAAPQLSLGEVVHTPANPVEGEDVLTTTTISNNEDQDAELRVVLLIDNDPVQQETIRVAPGATANVEFPWTAARGKNKVRVQVFEA